MSTPPPEPTTPTASLVRASDRGALSSRGTLVSLAVHAALLGAAVLLSRQALSRDEGPRVQVTFFDEERPARAQEEPGGGGGQPPPAATPETEPERPRVRRPQQRVQQPVEQPVEDMEFTPVPHLEGPLEDPNASGMGTPTTGSGGGFGTGTGSGVGSGTGPGIGSGAGAGARDAHPIYLPAGMSEPRRVAGAMPQYTRAAREARFQGEVIVRLEIAEDGAVRDVRILHGHPLLDDEIVRVLRRWRFSPPIVRGEPTSIYVIQRIAFQL